MTKSSTLLLLMIFTAGCGGLTDLNKPSSNQIYPQAEPKFEPLKHSPETNLIVTPEIPVKNNEKINNFTKCSEKYQPITAYDHHKFWTDSSMPNYFRGYFVGKQFEHMFFDNEISFVKFDENDPCKEIELTLSTKIPHTQHLNLAIPKKDIIDSLLNKSEAVIYNLAGYFISNYEGMPDNFAHLPHHNFLINIICPTGIKVSCEKTAEKCDLSKRLEAIFPETACTIRAVDQAFALSRPNEQVRISFDGTIKKTGTNPESNGEFEIKIESAEWKK